MPNEEYRICLGTHDLSPSTEEVVNHWAREGFKVYAIDNLGCIHMKREVDEALAEAISRHAVGPILSDTERDLLAAARRNWRDGVARYQDLTNLLEMIRRITGVTT